VSVVEGFPVDGAGSLSFLQEDRIIIIKAIVADLNFIFIKNYF
jgi:hypothetical protein